MNYVIGIGCAVVLLAVVIIGSIWKRKIIREEYEKFHERENSYTLVIKKHEWGDSVDKIIINAGEKGYEFTEESLKPENFKVTVTYDEMNSQNNELSTNTTTREIIEAYLCDIDGNRIECGSDKLEELNKPPHIALEMQSSRYEEASRPFIRGLNDENLRQKEIFDYEISHALFEHNINDCFDWISIMNSEENDDENTKAITE